MLIIPELTEQKIVARGCTGKDDFIGFSVHKGASPCRLARRAREIVFIHGRCTELSDLWTRCGRQKFFARNDRFV
jgi:hypothetical protein